MKWNANAWKLGIWPKNMQGALLEKLQELLIGTFNSETGKNEKYSVFKGTLGTYDVLQKLALFCDFPKNKEIK